MTRRILALHFSTDLKPRAPSSRRISVRFKALADELKMPVRNWKFCAFDNQRITFHSLQLGAAIAAARVSGLQGSRRRPSGMP